MIINLRRNKEIKCSGGDFKRKTEVGNDNLSLLAVDVFFHVPWMKHKKPIALFYILLLTESGYVLGHNYMNYKKVR